MEPTFNVSDLEHRMYYLVLYNISGKQQGIQAGHAMGIYQRDYGHKPAFERFINLDHTTMMMNGGTSNQTGTNRYNSKIQFGSMEGHKKALEDAKWDHSAFFEPDLNNAMSAIAFLVDERCWNSENFPDPDSSVFEISREDMKVPALRDQAIYEYWSGIIGTHCAWMRVWLKQFRFA